MTLSKDHFKIHSIIKFKFENSDLCSISYNSFLPELDSIKSTRSKISMEKKESILIFTIESKDIIAFRASVNEIISFGKIVDQTLHISENF